MRRRRGWTLIELLIYMGLGASVVGVAYGVAHDAVRLFNLQERGLSEIHSSLTLDEALEQDIRGAQAAIGNGKQLILHVGASRIVYSHDAKDGGFWRTRYGHGVMVSRRAFPFALDEFQAAVKGRLVSVIYRRRGIEARGASECPRRRLRVALWVEE
ncbi:MAG: prepilin-type N-terminal cleavage/methylation domain-containing protein [Planctomycetota bacterium]